MNRKIQENLLKIYALVIIYSKCDSVSCETQLINKE